MIDEKDWIFIQKNMPIFCVDVIILYRGKILLIKRKEEPAKDQWWVPGGRLIKGETIQEAAKRIIKREVGLNIAPRTVIHLAETQFDKGKFEFPIHTINAVMFSFIKDNFPIIRLDNNHSDYKWWDYRNEELELHPKLKEYFGALNNSI